MVVRKIVLQSNFQLHYIFEYLKGFLFAKSFRWFLLCFFSFYVTGFAQEVFDGKTYLPMPTPEYKLPKVPDFNDNRVVTQNPTTKEITYKRMPDIAGMPTDRVLQPGRGINIVEEVVNPIDDGSAKSFTNLEIVTDPTLNPQRRNVKIFFSTNEGRFVCSGSLISPIHVITAGHCVYSHDDNNPNNDDWVSDVRVIPAYENGDNPYGEARASLLTAWNGWIDNEDFAWDIGIITLDFPIGGIVGWLGSAYNTNNSFALNTTMHNFSYPSESPFNGQFMYYWYGTFDRVESNDQILVHNKVGYGGQSGSAAYYKSNDSRYAYAVTSFKNVGRQETGYARITKTIFDEISRLRDVDPPSYNDLVPFFVNLSKRTVRAGESTGDFRLDVHNWSKNNFSGSSKVEVYLSTNSTISTSDRLIKTYNYSNVNISAEGNIDFVNSATNPITIPANTPPGDYYVGVRMITSGDNTNNITKEWYLDKLTVTSPPPELSVSRSSISVPSGSGSTTFSISSNVNWSVSETASWLNVSPRSGSDNGTVTVSYISNASTSNRSTTITVSGPGVSSKSIVVTQAGASPTLTISPSQANVSDNSGSTTFRVNSNTSWTVSSNRSWATVSPSSSSGNRTVTVAYDQNQSTSNRTAIISVTTGGLTRNFTLNQEGKVIPPSLVVTPGTRLVPYTSTCVSFAVTSNVNWQLTSADSWITSINPSTGNNNGTFEICLAENPSTALRSGTVVISGGGLTRTITINQEGKVIPPTLTVTPSSSQLGADSGCKTFVVNSNVNWSVSSSASWITSVNPTSGSNNGTIQVCIAENSNTTSRSTQLMIDGGGITRVVTINQEGKPAGSTAPWSFNITGTNHTIIVPSDLVTSIEGQQLSTDDWIGFFYDDNGTLKCAGAGQWNNNQNSAIAVYGDDTNTSAVKEGFADNETFVVKVWKAAETKEYEVNASYDPTGGLITHTDQFGINGLSKLKELKSGSSGTNNPWSYTNTGVNHTIIIPMNLSADLNGNPLTADDWIGFFYEDNGTLKCAGAGQWNASSNSSIAVYGDDPNSTIKDGFTAGETFAIKVWQAATNTELEAEATFSPPGGIISHGNTFGINGISQLMSLSTAPSSMSLTINLNKGWNTISSYVAPESDDMLNIIAPINGQVEIVKDGSGNATIPAFGINNIGSWNMGEGYQIKVSNNTQLIMDGTPVDVNTPITILGGWQIIPVYSRTPVDAQAALSSITSIIEIVKDNNGASYIPSFGINSIGNLSPTQGYYLKASTNGVLNLQATAAAVQKNKQPRKFSNYYQLPEITGQSATIVLPAHLLGQQLLVGDEIVVKNRKGKVFGHAIYQGENMALTVWGDDPTTKAEDGFKTNEEMMLWVWKDASNQELPISELGSDKGHLTYKVNELYVLDQLKVKDEINEFVQIVPNPVRGQAMVNINLIQEEEATIRVIDAQGRVVAQYNQQLPVASSQLALDTKSFAKGIYAYELTTRSGKVMRSLFVVQ